jgi:hypothetical protein
MKEISDLTNPIPGHFTFIYRVIDSTGRRSDNKPSTVVLSNHRLSILLRLDGEKALLFELLKTILSVC